MDADGYTMSIQILLTG